MLTRCFHDHPLNLSTTSPRQESEFNKARLVAVTAIAEFRKPFSGRPLRVTGLLVAHPYPASVALP